MSTYLTSRGITRIVSLLVASSAPAFAQERPDTGSESSTATGVLTEVVVTAQRREQRMQDVGIAVTAMSGDQLQNLNISTGSDLAKAVPSLKMNSYASSAVVFNIRGVSQNDYGDQQEPPVAVYQDDSYSSTIALASFPLFDLARAEVARGPQGTLFGRNATGGAIQFISNQPTEEFEGYTRANYASYDHLRVEGAVSGPISDTLGFRLAGQLSDGGNYYNAVNPGMRDLGGDHNHALRGILKWTVNDQVSARLTARYLKAEDERNGGMLSHSPACPNAQLQGVYLPADQSCDYWGSPPGATGFGYRNDAINPERGGDPWNDAYGYPVYLNREVVGSQLRVDAALGGATLTSITDYQHAEKFYSEDTDGAPVDFTHYTAGFELDQSAQEFRISGTTGAHEWVVGTMGMIVDGDYEATFALPAFDYVPFADFGQRTRSYAFFGQDEWQIAPQVKLIGGLRYWHDRREGRFRAVEASSGVDVSFGSGGITYDLNGMAQPLPGLTVSPSDADSTFSAVTARAEIDYNPVDSVLLYVSYNRGSKSGGFTFPGATPAASEEAAVSYLNGIPYEPETLEAYELGMKATIGSSTNLNVAAFHYDYQDYQAFVQYFLTQTIVNLDAKETGLEAELTAQPLRGLLVALGASVLDSKVDNVPLPDGVTRGDKMLPQTPDFSANALTRYEWPWSQGMASVQADATYSSEFCFSILCAPVDKEQAYTVVNARVGYEIGPFAIACYVNNLADKQYRIYGVDNSLVDGKVYSVFARPRTYGVEISYRFGGGI